MEAVQPESAYVKSLEKETIRREQSLGVDNILKDAGQLSFPNLNIADINGKKVSLSSVVDANKAVLVHFWSSSDPTHSILNNEWVKTAHDLGMSVNSWTVDSGSDIDDMIALGVDAITSNEPLLVREHLGDKEFKK